VTSPLSAVSNAIRHAGGTGLPSSQARTVRKYTFANSASSRKKNRGETKYPGSAFTFSKRTLVSSRYVVAKTAL
jgi:hypothetical protein